MPSTNAQRPLEGSGMKRRRFTRKALCVLAGLALGETGPLPLRSRAPSPPKTIASSLLFSPNVLFLLRR
jgi:hypothetical protein